MARSLAVKIPTASLIADVEASIAKIEADLADYPNLMEKYRADVKAYNQKVADLAIQVVKKNPDLISTDHNSPIRLSSGYRGNTVQIEVDGDMFGFPEKPQSPNNPNDRTYYGRDYTTKLDLLKKNLKVLKMTNQEEVNASTYNTVMELL